MRFFCPHDPRPTHFQLSFTFGVEPGWLGANVIATNNQVLFNNLKFSISNDDDEGMKLASKADSKNFSSKQGVAYGWAKFYECQDYQETQNVGWRIICEIQYSVLAQDVEQDVAVVSLSRLQENLLCLLESGAYADVTFLAQGVRI